MKPTGRKDFQRNAKADDRAAGNVNGQCQPWPPDRLPMLAIHHHYVRQRVVDLEEVHREIRAQRRDSYRPELFSRSFGPSPFGMA